VEGSCWDLDERWTLLGFGGIGRVADSFGELDESDTPARSARACYLVAANSACAWASTSRAEETAIT
jgi:hypothetical protein